MVSQSVIATYTIAWRRMFAYLLESPAPPTRATDPMPAMLAPTLVPRGMGVAEEKVMRLKRTMKRRVDRRIRC